MPYPGYTNEEVSRRGEELYQRDIRPQVEKNNVDKFLVMDIESGDYAMGDTDMEATDHLLARRPKGILYGVRVGHRAAYSMGGGNTRIAP